MELITRVHEEDYRQFHARVTLALNKVSFDAMVFVHKYALDPLWRQESFQSHREALIAAHAFIDGLSIYAAMQDKKMDDQPEGYAE